MSRETGVAKRFFTGGEEYVVMVHDDTTFDEVYKVYRVLPEEFYEEDELVYTAYTKKALDAWIENLYIGNYEYDNNL